MLLGYARGKVGSLVFARLKGQQITRAYNPSPNDRKTNKQMSQRVKLPALVAFYQQNQAFFPFAFTSKKTTQSDYNAFVSTNLKNSDMPYLSKGQIAMGYPVVAPYIGTDGPVSEVACVWGNMNADVEGSGEKEPIGVVTTLKCSAGFDFKRFQTFGTFGVAEVSKQIVENNPDVRNGDMITFYLIYNPAVAYGGAVDIDKLNDPNIVASCQFTVDVASTQVASYFGLKFDADGRSNFLALTTNANGNICLASQFFLGVEDENYTPTDFETRTYVNASMSVCCVISRNNGVQKVSRSRFALSPIAMGYYTNASSAVSLADSIKSYGATGEALLENKPNNFTTGELTSKEVNINSTDVLHGGTIGASIELQPKTEIQSLTVSSLTTGNGPFTVRLYTEESSTPFSTQNNVDVGEPINVPAGYGLFLAEFEGAGITASTTGKVVVTYYA